MTKKETLKESTIIYNIQNPNLNIPMAWDWLKSFNSQEQRTFFQDIVDTVAAIQESKDWSKLINQINGWQKKAERSKEAKITEYKQTFIAKGGSTEVADLLGKYQGKLSSVNEFIHNKQIEKALEA